MEESAAIYFSSNISGLRGSRKLSTSSDQSHLLNGRDHSGLAGVGRGGVLLPKKVITTFAALLRLIVIFGAVICAFGVPYARLAVTLYGGELLTQNNGMRYFKNFGSNQADCIRAALKLFENSFYIKHC